MGNKASCCLHLSTVKSVHKEKNTFLPHKNLQVSKKLFISWVMLILGQTDRFSTSNIDPWLKLLAMWTIKSGKKK